MNCVQLINTQEIFESGETPFDTKLVAYLIEMIFIPLTDGITLGIWVSLINWDEFGTKAKPNDSYIYLLHRLFLLSDSFTGAPLCSKRDRE